MTRVAIFKTFLFSYVLHAVSWIYQLEFDSPFGYGPLVLQSALCSTSISRRC